MTDSEQPAGGWQGRLRRRWRELRRQLRALLYYSFGIGPDAGDAELRRPAQGAPAPVRRDPAGEPTTPRDVFLVAPGTISLLMPGVTRRLPALPGGAPRAGDSVRLPFGDFLGPAERDHFSALPPIDRRALDDVDWEALARELTRGA